MTFPETGTEAKNGDKPTRYVATSQLTLGGALELVSNSGWSYVSEIHSHSVGSARGLRPSLSNTRHART